MAYTINLTNGTVFATIADGTTNTNSSVTLVGKNYAGYGEFLDENFIQMLENFASTSVAGNPTAAQLSSPLTGQLWWDSTNNLLKCYTGSGWKVPTGSVASASTPSVTLTTGDLWFDTTNQQLKVYNGTAFAIVGPAFSASQGTSGAIPLSINDTGGTPHVVTGLYVANVLVSIFSSDSTFTPVAPFATAFPQIFQGTTTYLTGVIAGNLAANSTMAITVAGTNSMTIGSGNVTVNNLLSVVGNVQGGNLRTAGLVSATGNVIANNMITANATIVGSTGTLSALGNITGGNLLTVGQISATGNITGGNVLGGANVNATTHTGTTVSVSGNVTGGNILTAGIISAGGNVTGGNILTAGLISATGNVSGNFFLGNGSQLTGLSAAVSVTKIVNGTSSANIDSSGGDLTVRVNGTANVMVVGQTSTTVANLSVTNNITTTSVGTGNIGSVANPFNTVHAKATTAQYADVAERFAADQLLLPGTVVELGGEKEITKVQQDLSDKVFGVISTHAAFLMNNMSGDDVTHPAVAMTGRVPVLTQGLVHKGDRLVSAGNGTARAALPGEATAFNVIGRALTDKLHSDLGFVEAIVSIK